MFFEVPKKKIFLPLGEAFPRAYRVLPEQDELLDRCAIDVFEPVILKRDSVLKRDGNSCRYRSYPCIKVGKVGYFYIVYDTAEARDVDCDNFLKNCEDLREIETFTVDGMGVSDEQFEYWFKECPGPGFYCSSEKHKLWDLVEEPYNHDVMTNGFKGLKITFKKMVPFILHPRGSTDEEVLQEIIEKLQELRDSEEKL